MKDVFNGKYRISSIRLEGYDYATDGAYFITICSYRKFELFSTIRNGNNSLTPIGKIIREEWARTGSIRGNVTLDEFVIMPNHIHGIVFIHQDSSEPDHLPNRGSYLYFPENYRNEFGPQVNNLASIVRGFKSAVARRSKKESLEHRIWQARYYEHIIRNQPELERIRMYIRENPFQWELDEENEFKKSA